MSRSEKINKNADSLIDLLTEQCSDLEELLALAREETQAVKQGNFLGILDVVSQRSKLTEKLETFQQQVTELRSRLEVSVPIEVSKRVIELSNLTLYQDRETKKLLTSAKDEASNELKTLENSNRKTNAYIKKKSKGLAYERDV